MIIKISYLNGWVVYDNFEKVHYRHYNEKEISQFDTDAIWTDSEPKTGHSNWVLINARKKTFDENKMGPEFTIKSANRVYLCNDEGKTIEKIN